VILIALRMLQGLALGGEYGGAATYVAEHAPHGKRGAYTSWIQTTATLGLFLSLLVILGVREAHGPQGMGSPTGAGAFPSWSRSCCWPSVWIRLSLNESPAFQKMKSEGKTSKAPLTESFGEWKNLKIVILALLGLTAGQAVVWYTGQFYALFFMTTIAKVDVTTANLLIAASLLIGTPFFIVFGTLSDKIGRKPIIMAGCLIAALTYFARVPDAAEGRQPGLVAAQQATKVTVTADPNLLVPGQPDRPRHRLHQLLRHRQARADAVVHPVREQGGPGRVRRRPSAWATRSDRAERDAERRSATASPPKAARPSPTSRRNWATAKAAGLTQAADKDKMNKAWCWPSWCSW
jgi:MFS family permease